jgi:hypothetical protein
MGMFCTQTCGFTTNICVRYPYIFAQTFNINEGLSNICFVGIMVGILLASVLVPFIYRSTVRQLKRDGDDGSGKAIHRESRLYFAMIGAPALPIGLFWMGWTDYVSVSPNSLKLPNPNAPCSPQSPFGPPWQHPSS